MSNELPSTITYSDESGEGFQPPATIGRFEVTGVLGRGGSGVVLAGRDPALGRTVAIKLIPEKLSAAGRERFEREARAMAKLGHPNVVAVFEVGEVDGHPFIAMELVDGQTLRSWQATRPKWRTVVAVYVDAARGLAAAHAAGLVHRDFKPDNVLIGADLRPRVSDFGLVSEPDREPTGATTRAELDKLIPALAGIPSPNSCADARTLASFTMPPSPRDRTEAAAISRRTTRS